MNTENNEEIVKILKKYNYTIEDYKDEIDIRVDSFLKKLSKTKDYFTWEELSYEFSENNSLENLWYDNHSNFVNDEEQYYEDMDKLDSFKYNYAVFYLSFKYEIEFYSTIGMFNANEYLYQKEASEQGYAR